MTDIFISYAGEDRPTARRLAEALEACGWSIWWDDRGLRGGQHFHRVIEKAILSARVIIVVWSHNSISSNWVLDEATLGRDERKLVPVRIDRAVPPLGFRTIHTLDLSSWTKESEAEPFERLLETLGHYLGPPKKAEQPDGRAGPRSQAEPTDVAADPPGRKPVKKYVLAALAIAGLLLGVVMLGGKQEVLPPERPTETISPKPPASTEDVVAAISAAYERGDDETALDLARPAAAQGNAVAQYWLGGMYYQGRGVAQDDAEAVRWWREAAAQGNAVAQYWLGGMYYQGRGVAQDDAEAVRWWREAAAQGNADAQFNLGGMYYQGRGVAQDDGEAVQWYRKAAAQGDALAQNNLGVMYEYGRGVARDDAEAVQWYRKAAEQGDADAQNRLDLLSTKESR